MFFNMRENGGVKAAFFHNDVSRFSRTLEVNNIVSDNFQTQVSMQFLISMKLCTKITNKKGKYESAITTSVYFKSCFHEM